MNQRKRKRNRKKQAGPPTLADIVREATDDGRVIAEFYRDLIQGRIPTSTERDRYIALQSAHGAGLLPFSPGSPKGEGAAQGSPRRGRGRAAV